MGGDDHLPVNLGRFLIYCALKGGGRDRGGGDLKTVGSQKDRGSKHCFRVRTL